MDKGLSTRGKDMGNITFDEIRIGDYDSYVRTVTQQDINRFAMATGDENPVHLSEEFAKSTQFGGIIAHGMLTASYISTVLGTQYPGQGTIFLGLNDMKFKAPVKPGDTITTTVTVSDKHPGKPVVTFDCACTNQDGHEVLSAKAVVLAPTQKIAAEPERLTA